MGKDVRGEIMDLKGNLAKKGWSQRNLPCYARIARGSEQENILLRYYFSQQFSRIIFQHFCYGWSIISSNNNACMVYHVSDGNFGIIIGIVYDY